ncbi:DUF2927 domain-containing protein [Palleronia caenipelagi]|uniref:DUF2927 domain-containing protein n=1 Tax=Palleronia caenipelagi TaxID=2489174 RepID=UPI001FEBDDFF|nr:DUF2927 domain-containing protein [Palleronia caenipelagi]
MAPPLETAALPAPVSPVPPAPAAHTQKPARPQDSTLGDYYQLVQNRLLRQGLLRTDRGGADTPWDADRLARTFFDLAFYEEYAPNSGVHTAQLTRANLRRFDKPVRIEMRFGDSVPAEMEASDRAEVRSYADRLSRATGHPVSTVGSGGNFIIFVVDEDERRSLGPELKRLAPGLTDQALNTLLDLPQTTYCVVFAVDNFNNNKYSRAISIIRAEHPDLLRQSCYHEEIAQGLGMSNDSPRARPSIFNDDEEFALLTDMDERLMGILYDPRLRAGMSLEEARPLVRLIAEERAGGSY